MKRQKRRTDKQLQRIIGIVCLSFLLGTAGGALLANLLPQGQQGQLSAFLQQALADGDEISFAAIFWKYLKYDIIIWLGSWGFSLRGRRSCFGASVSASPLP